MVGTKLHVHLVCQRWRVSRNQKMSKFGGRHDCRLGSAQEYSLLILRHSVRLQPDVLHAVRATRWRSPLWRAFPVLEKSKRSNDVQARSRPDAKSTSTVSQSALRMRALGAGLRGNKNAELSWRLTNGLGKTWSQNRTFG